MDPAATERRFLDGLASNAGVDRDALAGPGTTVVAGDGRAGSGALACYRTGAHLVVWGDPAVVDRAADLAGPEAVTESDLTRRLAGVGFGRLATVISNLLAGPPAPPTDLAPGYLQRWLHGDTPGVVDAVRAFTERCHPDDVEAAALDELDDFAEDAINVIIPADNHDDDPPDILAYASASAWDWDPTLADIGVLVAADLRRRGLASYVVASTVAQLLVDGRVPLYRHEAANLGSAAVAARIGFRPVARLDYFVDQPDGVGPEDG